MYPDISYVFHDLFGTAPGGGLSVVKMFGFMLAMAFFGSAWALSKELKRRTELGQFSPKTKEVWIGKKPGIPELWSPAIFGFIIGFKLLYILQNSAEFIDDAASVILSTKGSILGGIALAIVLAAIRWYVLNKKVLDTPKKEKLIVQPQEMVGDITIVAALSGIIGAKAFTIFENFDDFLIDPLGQLLSGSGLTIYGGLILAFIVVYWYVKKLGLKPIHVMDAVAPALILGYAIGRLGCHFSGDGDWGIVNTLAQPSWFFLPDWMWAHEYPRNVISWDPANVPLNDPNCVGDYCHKLGQAVFPTPVYESIAGFSIFAILWSLRKKIVVPGALFFIYLIFNGVERFFIEFIRVNTKYDYLGVHWSQAQWIALGLVLGGSAALLYLYKFKKTSRESIAKTN